MNKFAKLAGRVKNDIAYSIPYSGKTNVVAPHDNNQPVLLDTAIGSQNTGDQIIMGFVNEHLSKFMDTENAIRIPTHVMDPDVYTPDILNRAKILCGTNALFSDFDLHPSISLPASPRWYSHQVVLMAVGMRSTKRAPHFDFLTAKILQNLLSPDYLHSVRDEHTRTELARIGIENVINTACVTMWNLTEKFCEDIPVSKAENVLTTITDYDFDPVNDEYMLQTLGITIVMCIFGFKAAATRKSCKKLTYLLISSSLKMDWMACGQSSPKSRIWNTSGQDCIAESIV